MARSGLSIGVRDLAEAAHVSTNTVTRFEKGDTLKPRTVEALRRALEAAGAVFLSDSTGDPGVSIKKDVSS
jgi:transcriptional regulator with XRE-family HTH domain